MLPPGDFPELHRIHRMSELERRIDEETEAHVGPEPLMRGLLTPGPTSMHLPSSFPESQKACLFWTLTLWQAHC